MRFLGTVVFALAVLAGSPASAINTFQYWDGRNNVGYFGCPNTTTYGEVITAPKAKTHLNGFIFWWQNINGSRGSMVVRGEVYAWDKSRASGTNLYESEPRTISFHDGRFHKEAFPTAISVTPGAKYVVFVSIDKDYEQCSMNYNLYWGAVGDIYPKGRFVFQNNAGDEGKWTNARWNTLPLDLAMKVLTSP